MKIIYCVGLVGNGKSTLFNKLLQQKYSLVMPNNNNCDYQAVTHNYISAHYKNCLIVDTPYILNTNILDPYDNHNDKIYIYIIRNYLKTQEISFIKTHKQKNRKIFGYYDINITKPHIIEEITYKYSYLFNCIYDQSSITNLLHDLSFDQDEINKKQVALIGRVNSGKSYLFNDILNNNRSLVADYACATRNYIEEPYKDFFLIDTPGYDLNKSSLNSMIKNYRDKLIYRYHVIILVINGSVPVSRLDKQVFGQLNTLGCFCCIYINRSNEKFLEDNKMFLKQAQNKYPVFFKKKQLIKSVIHILSKLPIRITTPKLNKWIHSRSLPLRSASGAPVKIKYLYQKDSNPIIIEYFAKHPMTSQSLKILKQSFRTYFELPGVQVKFFYAS